MLEIETATYNELITEWNVCQEQWGALSCDCFGFYINALHKKIVELGGWPTHTK